MDKEIAEEEEALLFLLPSRRTGQKRKKKHKSQDFGLETIFVQGSNMKNIATSTETEKN